MLVNIEDDSASLKATVCLGCLAHANTAAASDLICKTFFKSLVGRWVAALAFKFVPLLSAAPRVALGSFS